MSQSTSGKNILVVGATGNVGSFATPALLEKGESVRCMVRDESKAPALREAGAEVVVGNLDDRESLERSMTGIDTVFLVIATGRNMQQQGLNAIAAAKNTGVERIVRYSLIQVDEMADLPSVRMQAHIDEVLESSGLQFTHVRPTNYMQNYLIAVPTIQSDSTMNFPFGDARIGMGDVRDMADAAVEALTGEGHEGKSYSITGPKALNLHEVAAAISEAIGKKVTYVDVSPDLARQGLLSLGMDEWVVNEYMSYFAAFKAGHANVVTGDFTKLTGKPSRTIEQFARDYASMFNPELATASG